MFDDLAVVAPDYVLPNADAIPRNAVVALEPTHELIAAFLVGLNSELGRELVWRGFPVDRRTTFFARFWDHRGQSGGRDDIAPIGDWDPASLLAAGTAGGGSLILAVRGDLLLRYPRTLVYAVSAAPSPTGPVLPAPEHEEPRAPLFSGLVPPDIRFFGFDFGDDDPRSGQDDPGSFFVFQEQATEARFGAPAGGPLPLDGNSADVATAALRPAARVAIHADELLPR
jgi:hypothetical protein